MNIAVVGTGYVGLVTGACFAETGVDVVCVDTDAAKIAGLNRGIVPIYEPGLADLVARNLEAGRLRFVTDLAPELDRVEAVFIAVGTPSGEDGSADLSHVLDVAQAIGRNMNDYLLVVTKSTVPVGTSEMVRGVIARELEARGVQTGFDVAANPEFLKEGAAVNDFMHPDRVVAGVDTPRAREIVERLYKPFMVRNDRMILTDIASAEMIKYASNAMLATRISFMNEIARLCELTGADVGMVRRGVGSDSRIGDKFLYPGCGYGGSCLPKDVKALMATARERGYEMKLLGAVEEVNEWQKSLLFRKLDKHFDGALAGKTIGVWGLAFKPETDDVREAPALVLIAAMLGAGCRVRVYDPAAMEQARATLGDSVEFCDSLYTAAEEADAVMLVTEWKEFRNPDWRRLRGAMKQPVLFDGRNIYIKEELEREAFTYYKIG